MAGRKNSKHLTFASIISSVPFPPCTFGVTIQEVFFEKEIFNFLLKKTPTTQKRKGCSVF